MYIGQMEWNAIARDKTQQTRQTNMKFDQKATEKSLRSLEIETI